MTTRNASIRSSAFEHSEPSSQRCCRSHSAHFLTDRYRPLARSEASRMVPQRAGRGGPGGGVCARLAPFGVAAARRAGLVGASAHDQLRNGLAEVDPATHSDSRAVGGRTVCGGALTVPERPTPAELNRCVTLTIDAACAHRQTFAARPPDPSEPGPEWPQPVIELASSASTDDLRRSTWTSRSSPRTLTNLSDGGFLVCRDAGFRSSQRHPSSSRWGPGLRPPQHPPDCTHQPTPNPYPTTRSSCWPS